MGAGAVYGRGRTGKPGPRNLDEPEGSGVFIDYIEYIGLLEADFQREYGIDLVMELRRPEFSFRRFKILVSGLSTNSRIALEVQRLSDTPKVVTDPIAAQRAFDAWGR